MAHTIVHQHAPNGTSPTCCSRPGRPTLSGITLAGALGFGVTSTNLVQLLEVLDGSATAFGYVINYNYYLLPALGVLGIIMGMAYGYVIRKTYAYALATDDIDARKEETRLAGQRPLIALGTECRLKHMVDKPSLEGATAQIATSTPDEQGLIAVVCDGTELKVEEFQLGVLLTDEQFAEAKEVASLRYAELVHNYDKRGDRVK